MLALIFFLLIFPRLHSQAFMPQEEIAQYQKLTSGWAVGERIAFWAERFVGIPYDKDELGEYVRKSVIVTDSRVDCMYHVFRSVELALSDTPEAAEAAALDKRFTTLGKVESGRVVNYEERFRYGEDMIDSGKWGREVTREIGKVALIAGTRGKAPVEMVSGAEASSNTEKFRSGDIVFFINRPDRRTSDALVGHMGIIKNEGTDVYLIHASGTKHSGGKTEKVLLRNYLASMKFAGIRVCRFEPEGGMGEMNRPNPRAGTPE